MWAGWGVNKDFKYHDVFQIIGFSWVSFAFSTHFWHLQTPSNKGFISYLQLSPCFIFFIIIIQFTLTTKICKKLNLFLVTKKLFYSKRKMMQLFKIFRKATLQNFEKIFVYILISNF